jgi:hypothetical protein
LSLNGDIATGEALASGVDAASPEIAVSERGVALPSRLRLL